MHKLAGNMFRCQLDAQRTGGKFANFVFDVGSIVGEFVAELPGDFNDAGFVRQSVPDLAAVKVQLAIFLAVPVVNGSP